MRKLILGLGLIAISLSSCGKQNQAKLEVKEDVTPKLYITKSIVKGKLGSGEESKKYKETSVFSDTYIELSATQSTLGGYQAQYKLPSEEGSDGIYTVGYLIVTDKEGNTLNYETPSEFLNYMNGMGYEMATEKSHKYGKIYTFKKK